MPEMQLGEGSFIVVKDPEGEEIDDISNEEENEAIGDLTTPFLRSKAGDPSVRLRCSPSQVAARP